MLDSFKELFKKFRKKDSVQLNSSDAAKERLHMVLMQDRANVSAEYIDLMKQDIIDDIKKYVDVDEKEIDVRLTNQIKNDGSNGAPALYANIPITGIKNDKKQENKIKSTGNTSKKKPTIKNSILGADAAELLAEEKLQDESNKVKNVKKTTAKKSSVSSSQPVETTVKEGTVTSKVSTKVEVASAAVTKTTTARKKSTATKVSDEAPTEEKTKVKSGTKATKTKSAGTKKKA